MFVHAIENQIFRKAAPMAIIHLAKPDLKTTQPLAREVIDQTALEFQVAPPVTLHMADPQLMAGVWSAAREAYVVNASGRAMREAVAAAVSQLNECPYCVTVHSSLFASTANGLGALDDPSQLPADIKAAHQWASATLSPTDDRLKNPAIDPADLPQIMGTAIVYHYINRMVSVFLQETPVALPGMGTALGQKMMRASFTFFGKRFARLDPAPGQFVWLQKAELPGEFSWAKTNPHVAHGLAQLAYSAEHAGQQAVPGEVRTLVLDHLNEWHGEPSPLSRHWVEELVGTLHDADKPSARLALLCARAAWQVDDQLIADFRQTTPR